MTFQYVSVEEAIKLPGLRMVVVGGVPSSWGEAAKGILHIKNIKWVAVRLAYDNEALKEWAGQQSGPVVVYNNEPPRAGWAEILTPPNAWRQHRRYCPQTRRTAPLFSAWHTKSAAKKGWAGHADYN